MSAGRLITLVVFLSLARYPTASADPEKPPGEDEREVIYVYGSEPRAGVDDLDGDGTEHRDAGRALNEPVFVTVVHVDERAGETVAVAEVLAESVGVDSRTLGGLGAFSSVSIRGAAPAHTSVSIDGVPLSRFTTQGADLGSFELTSFSEIEVYRGGVPARLGGASMGGAVNFVTALGRRADGRRITLSMGAGSFDARHMRARFRDTWLGDSLDVHATVGYSGARGDYEFFSDNGTPLDTNDDDYLLRTNNSFSQGDLVLRMRWFDDETSVEGGTRTLVKSQGIPGRDTVQTREASLSTWNQLVDLRVAHRAGPLSLMGSTFLLFEDHAFRDILGEVGIGTEDHHYRTWVFGTADTMRFESGSAHITTLGMEGRIERFIDRDRIDVEAPPVRGRRLSAAVSISDQAFLAGGRISLEPAARFDLMNTDPGAGWDPVLVDPDALGERLDLFLSPRVSARANLAEAFVLKSSVGRYFRAPTLLELFGDRGFLVGDPSLDPETGTNADLGIALVPSRGRGPIDRVYLEAALFASAPRDAIAFVPSAGRVAVARNIGDATIYGLESALTARLWRRATLTANYTAIESTQRHPMPSFDGKRLPGRPRHQLYGRMDLTQRLAGELAVLWGDISYTSGNYLDQANRNEVPRRIFFGLGVKIAFLSGLLMALEIKNLTDERVERLELANPPTPALARIPRAVADVLGYPLPGRSFYLRIDWSF